MLALVLGGGAAKGYAHIGVLKVLDEEGLRPDIVVGASMGALVGGFYAAGFTPAELEEIACRIDKKTKHWLFELTLSGQGLVDGKNVIKYLDVYLKEKTIEQLPMKFAAVATDIDNEAEVILDRGDLVQAIRAAISIPVVFTPHLYSGRVLIDGGFVNPLPVTLAQQLGATKIIAVNVLHKPGYDQVRLNAQVPTGKKYSMKQVLEQTIALIFARLTDYQAVHLENGLLINVDTRSIGVSQFEKGKAAIARGYDEADKHRSAIRKLARHR